MDKMDNLQLLLYHKILVIRPHAELTLYVATAFAPVCLSSMVILISHVDPNVYKIRIVH